MECLIGITGKDHVVLAADMNTTQGAVILKSDEDKVHAITSKVAIAACGKRGDTVRISEYIANNMQLYKVKNGYELSPKAVAHFTRNCLAEALRTAIPYEVNLLLAGYDSDSGPELYFMDFTAGMKKMAVAAHGLGGMIATTILDRHHTPDMTSVQTYDLLQTCIGEVQKRLIINTPNFKVKIIDKDGIRSLEPVTIKNFL